MLSKALRRAALVLIAAAVLVAVALLVAQDQRTVRFRSPYGVADPGFSEDPAALVGAPLTRGNTYEVLTNGNQFFPAMLEAVADARHRISFETYIYDDGEIGGRFTAALERAARRGVDVRLVADAVGAAGMSGAHSARLRAAGAAVVEFNRPAWYSLEEVNYRTHRKILVVDGRLGFTGGAGVADHWTGDAEGPEHWRDTQVRMRGPVVRQIEAAFYESLAEAGGIVTPAIIEVPEVDGDDAPSLVVGSSPTGGSNELKRLYLLAIAAARQTLDIASPYFVTDESTRWAIEDAVARGVRVRILVEGDETDAMPVKYASRVVDDHLLQLGIEIYEYQPTMMHAKVLVVDGVLSMFGSANFDNRSLELNDELNVAVVSRDLAARFLADFERDLRASRRLRLDEWRRRPLLDKTLERFWSFFGEVF